MIICTKCGTENENGSKFCKSCGTALEIVSQETVSVVNSNSTMQTVKKVLLWIAIAVILFFSVVLIVNFINDKQEDSKVRELRNGCANNNAQACYELGLLDYFGYGMFNSEKKVDYNENQEALAKGCQLGNKHACREAKYYQKGCALQDGESCYLFAQDIHKFNGIEGSVSCSMNPSGYGCKLAKSFDETDIKHYLNLSCEYGYSQGCMSK